MIWCKCADGKWYRGPEWRGYDATGRRVWHVLTDDFAPLEMVVRDGYDAPTLPWLKLRKQSLSCYRQFGRKMVWVRSYRMKLHGLPPVPTSFSDVADVRPDQIDNIWHEPTKENR